MFYLFIFQINFEVAFIYIEKIQNIENIEIRWEVKVKLNLKVYLRYRENRDYREYRDPSWSLRRSRILDIEKIENIENIEICWGVRFPSKYNSRYREYREYRDLSGGKGIHPQGFRVSPKK